MLKLESIHVESLFKRCLNVTHTVIYVKRRRVSVTRLAFRTYGDV